MELQILKPSDYGLEETKAHEISKMFKPMLDKMEELEDQYNEIAKLEISPETCKKAKELRLQYVKTRTGTAKIHKELKAFYLNGGRFVDGWKNVQLMASQGIEQKLQNIELHFENLEKEKKKKRFEERSFLLSQYGIEDVPSFVSDIEDQAFQAYFEGVKKQHHDRIEAEKKAEAERLEREKLEAEERERVRLENEKLRKEAAEREAKEAAERAKHEAELKKQREENERIQARLTKEAEERKRLEDEKKTAEAKRLADEEKAFQAELNKNDTEKVVELKNSLGSIKSKFTFKSKRNQKMYSDVCILIDRIIKYMEER